MTTTSDKHIPSIEECLTYFDQFAMLENIRAHSLLVARVAAALRDGLAMAGKTLGPLPNREETVAGALMHDIAKTLCIKTGCHHAEVGQEICKELGYPQLGEIVAEHVVLRHFNKDAYHRGVFGAKELVYYADKRVLHDQVVPLAERLEYILKRYGSGNPVKETYIRQNFGRTVDFENALFKFLDFTADAIIQHLPPALHPPAPSDGEP